MAQMNAAAPPTTMQRILDIVERVGNKVPHPVVIFVILIGDRDRSLAHLLHARAERVI